MTPRERIEATGWDETTDGCWEWRGESGANGRGRISIGGRKEYAYRAAWEVARGPIPEGLHVCHRCDNPRCIRPEHLFLGTQRQNIEDAATKARTAHGERSGRASLTDAQAEAIRAVWRGGGVTQVAIAALYGIDKQTVHRIIKGETRRHSWSA